MSEPTNEPTVTDPAPQGDPVEPTDLGEGGKKAIESERTARKEAEKKAAELQKQLDAVNQANETALEKAQREAQEAREALPAGITDAFREAAVAFGGINAEDAELFLTGSDKETLAKQAARLVEKAPASGQPKPDLSQGGKGATAPTTAEQFAQALESALN